MPAFKISIPTPCSQDWDGMAKLDGGGRHCGECKKTVVDFSRMTDQELMHFFNINNSVHCGRFHHTQLDRQIVPLPKTNRFLSKANTIAAAAMTVLSLKALPTQADERKTVTENIVVSHKNQDAVTLPPDKIIISGTVTGDDGKLLANAKVLLDTVETFTDKQGRFSFELGTDSLVPHNLYFSFDGLVPVVRSYHPIMLSTVFDVQLPNRNEYFGLTMGMPLPFWSNIQFPELDFKQKNLLTAVDRKQLDRFARELLSNPGFHIVFVGFAKSAEHEKRVKKRTKAVIDYLVEKHSLSAERFKQEMDNKYDSNAISAYGMF